MKTETDKLKKLKSNDTKGIYSFYLKKDAYLKFKKQISPLSASFMFNLWIEQELAAANKGKKK